MLRRRASRYRRRLAACSTSCTDLRVRRSATLPSVAHLCPDASDFLRKHPWPGRAISDTFDDDSHRKGGLYKKFMGAVNVVCGKTGAEEEDDGEEENEDRILYDASEDRSGHPFYWTPALQDNFREELEKYVHSPHIAAAPLTVPCRLVILGGISGSLGPDLC